MTSKGELACIYASLILVDDDLGVTAEKIQTLLKAANVDVESYWPGLFASALQTICVKEFITQIASGVGAAPAGGAAVAAAAPASTEAAPAKEEKKKEEPEEESDEDMGFGLFD